VAKEIVQQLGCVVGIIAQRFAEVLLPQRFSSLPWQYLIEMMWRLAPR